MSTCTVRPQLIAALAIAGFKPMGRANAPEKWGEVRWLAF